MEYFEEINEITKHISPTIVDFSLDRDRASPPTQASSNFITNKEQGDWAEDLIFRAINETLDNYVAVRYGKSNDLIAGDSGFAEFYNEYQNELDTIGKRPDLLIFKKDDFNHDYGHDISSLRHSDIEGYVRKSIAGLEVRSSVFLIDKYEEVIQERTKSHFDKVIALKKKILSEYVDLLQDERRVHFVEILNSINKETIKNISFRRPSWRASDRLQELSALFKDLKESLVIVQKRDYLSITPKIEDIKVVHKWINNFNVPHYYFQVFFDKSYGVSFKNILGLLADPDKEGVFYEISQDVHNQNKTKNKINTRKTTRIAYKVEEPEHSSIRKEMARGKLLFYVSFDGGTAYLDVAELKTLLNIEN